MPALVVLGRRWHIAADDLPVPSFLGGAWHLCWMVIVAVDLSYVVRQLPADCDYRDKHIGFLSAHLGCFAINTVLHTWTLHESIRGSMFQVRLRRRVGGLVLAVVTFYCLTIANNVYGTLLVHRLARRGSQCVPLPGDLTLNQGRITAAIVIATWIGMFVGFVAMLATLNFFAAYSSAARWLGRVSVCRGLSKCCCCTKGRGRGRGGAKGVGASEGAREADPGGEAGTRNLSPMIVIANIFTEVFGTVDMTLSDYAAAFTLVGVRHRHAKPAWAYSTVAPPPWLTVGLGDGAAREGVAAPGQQYTPPAVMEIAAVAQGTQLPQLRSPTPRPGMLGAKAAGFTNGSAASPTADGASIPPSPSDATLHATDGTNSTTPTTTSIAAVSGSSSNFTPTIAVAAPATTASPFSTLITNTVTTTEPHAVKEPHQLPTSPGSSQPTLPQYGSSSAQTHTTSKPAADASNGTHTPPSFRRDLSMARVFKGQLSHVTQEVFGLALLPGGDTPSLLDPGREWSGDKAEANVSIEVMDEALYYMLFATAVYGWKMYLWMNRTQVTNCCRLCLGRGCGCCRQAGYFVRGMGRNTGPSEGCCSPAKLMEREAITQITGVEDEDILYVCYDNRVGGLLPYYIAVDRPRRSVVVGIRGSLSLNDVVTDLLCEPVPFDVPGVDPNDKCGRRVLWAHRGILECATAILKDIEAQGVLQAALSAWPQSEEQQEAQLATLPSERARNVLLRLRGTCAGWRLVLTGHSLGGGVTGLLGPLLQSKYPNLRCWAYAPPAGLMSTQAAELTRAYCVSVVHAKDMIPRLAVATMEQLVQELVTAGAHCRASKAWIFARLMLLGRRPDQRHVFLRYEDMSPDQQAAMKDYMSNVQACKVSSRFSDARSFSTPGHILYVERRKLAEGPPPCCSCNVCCLDTSSRGAEYVCRWIDPADLLRGGLVVSRSMFLDHMPDNTLNAMQMAFEQARAAAGLGGGSSAGSGGLGSVPRGAPVTAQFLNDFISRHIAALKPKLLPAAMGVEADGREAGRGPAATGGGEAGGGSRGLGVGQGHVVLSIPEEVEEPEEGVAVRQQLLPQVGGGKEEGAGGQVVAVGAGRAGEEAC